MKVVTDAMDRSVDALHMLDHYVKKTHDHLKKELEIIQKARVVMDEV